MDKKYLLETWREIAYNQQQTQEQYDQFWGAYFAQEVEVYKDLLKNHGTVVSGTVEVSLDYDDGLLYKNMVEAKADWLYGLEEWNDILDADKQKKLYKEQKLSGTVFKDKKIGRNDPCPCGSGKKYKYCCGRN